jgi:hypothetical protein
MTDQSIADAVQRLQVELIGGFGRDELHGRALHRLGTAVIRQRAVFGAGLAPSCPGAP